MMPPLLTARTDIMIQAGYSGNRLEHSYRMAGSIDAGLTLRRERPGGDGGVHGKPGFGYAPVG